MSATKNIPNFLTGLRLVFAIIFPYAGRYQLAVIFFAIATEFLDGYLARLLNATSQFGQIFDPIADKIFFFSAGITVVLANQLRLEDFLIVSLRDLFVIIAIVFLMFIGKSSIISSMRSLSMGKVTTCLQYVVLISAVRFGYVSPMIIFITAAFSLTAVFQYAFWFFDSSERKEQYRKFYK